MRVVTFIVSLFFLSQTASPQARPGVRFEGIVVEGTTDQPLSGVTVQLAGLNAHSDSKGQFSFEKVSAGRHILVADKAGYLRARPEGRKLGEGGIQVTISGDQKSLSIHLRMFRAGAVSGRILNAQGEPLQYVLVLPYRSTYDNDGRLTLKRVTLSSSRSVAAGVYVATELRKSFGLLPADGNNEGFDSNSNVIAGRTNDLGEFRIPYLDPGKYAFYIIPQNPRNNVSVDPSLVPEFYPGVTKPEDADILEIESGSDVQLRTISLVGNGSALARLRLVDESEVTLAARPVYQVRRKGSSEAILQSDFFSASAETCTTEPTICYVPRLPAGSYEVEAVVPGVASIAAAQMPLEMTGVDVEMDIRVPKGTKVTGIVATQRAGSPPLPAGGIRMNLKPDTILPNIQFTMTSDSNGTILMPNIPSSLYHVKDVSGIPSGMCLDEIREGDRNVLRDGLDVSGSDVTFNARIGKAETLLQGTVTDAGGKKVEGSVVVLVPDDRARSEAYALNTTDQEGAFELTCMQPGAYHLYAWLELEGAAYRNAEFMKKFEGRGEPLQIEPGQTVSIDLKLLGDQ